MKKLSILFILLSFSICLFAAPKIPKYTFDSDEDEPDELVYVSNDLQNYYILSATCLSDNSFAFIKKSFSNNIVISININCNSEKEIDYIISKIDTTDIDNEFTKLRKNIMAADLLPSHFIMDRNTEIPKAVIYYIPFSETLF
jgi:hypothetical protein